MNEVERRLLDFANKVFAMRKAQRRAKQNPLGKFQLEANRAEAAVDNYLDAILFPSAGENLPPLPSLIPDPTDMPPVPLPVPFTEDNPVPIPLVPTGDFELPPVPPAEVPPVEVETPSAEVEQKRPRRRGGQHGGS